MIAVGTRVRLLVAVYASPQKCSTRPLTPIPAGTCGTVRAVSSEPDDTYLLVRLEYYARPHWARVAPWLVVAT